MADWRNELVDASLDGIPFGYLTSASSFGRRQQMYEYANRDTPRFKDLGRRARRFTLSAFVIARAENGFNHLPDRDRIIAAVESAGDHVLMHPYYGRLPIRIVGEVPMLESTAEGGWAKFTLNCVRVSETNLRTVPDSAGQVRTFVEVGVSAFADNTNLKTQGFLDFVVNAAVRGVNDASSAMRRVNGKISAKLGLIDQTRAAIDAFDKEVNTLISTPDQLTNKFAALMRSTLGLAKTSMRASPPSLFQSFFRRHEILMESHRELVAFAVLDAAPPLVTDQRVQEQTNQDANQLMVRGLSVVETSNTLIELDIPSADAAQAIGDQLADDLDDIIEGDVPDQIFEALYDLRGAILNHLDTTAQNLPRIVRVKLPRTIPTLLWAHQLYGDARREQELLERNGIRHPLLSGGGIDLEYLDE